MLLKKFEENWSKVQKIGIEAEERAKARGIKLSWPEEKPEEKKSPIEESRRRIQLTAEKH